MPPDPTTLPEGRPGAAVARSAVKVTRRRLEPSHEPSSPPRSPPSTPANQPHPCSQIPATTRGEHLLHWIRPALRETGDLALVDAVWSRLRADGNGADRQRAAYRHRSSLTDVVDHLIAVTSN
jgi:hypothetical protein